MRKFTRQDYLDNQCSHREYYAQFINQGVKNRVQQALGLENIQKSTDPYFNDIPLMCWDQAMIPVPGWIAIKMKELGDYATLSSAVCIAKEAAKQIKNGE